MKFLNQVKSKKRKSFFLSAGGSRAAFQWGAIEALRSNEIKPDKAWGVSGGGLNAGLIGVGDLDFGSWIWSKLEKDWIFEGSPTWRMATFKSSFYSMDPLMKTFDKYLKDKPTNVPASVIATSLETGESKAFHNKDENFFKGMRASASIPGVFEPTEIDGELYVDGGIKDYSPMKYAIEDSFEADLFVVISTKPRDKRFSNELGRWKRIWEVIGSFLPITMQEIFKSDFDKFETINRLVAQAEKNGFDLISPSGRKYKKIDYLYIEPDKDLGSGLDFSRNHIDEMLEAGRKAARKALAEFKK